MSKADKTKEFIIERSAPVFNRKGYTGTSLCDIMEATGLTKGSIYGNFENKDEVAIAAYQYSINGLNKRLAEAMSIKKTALDKLYAFSDYYRGSWKAISERGGCPIQNACIEADDNAPFLKKHVQASVKSWAGGLEKIIEEGRRNGEIKKSADAKKASYDIITILEGGVMLAKIMNNGELLFAALDRVNQLIKTELKS